MNRTPSSLHIKKMIVETLQRDNFIQNYSDKVTEIITAFRLDSQSGSNYTIFYEQIASWIIENYQMIKNNITGFFQDANFQNLSDTLKQYLLSIIANFSKKLNEQIPNNEMFPIKNHGYNNPYPPYNYPYSSQGYPMNNPSMMYPHPPYYGNNTEQFEKLYREQLQYYMQMQQMPMNFPSYMQGYGMAHDQYNPQIKNNSMPDQMSRPPNISISKPALNRNMADQSRSEGEINKNTLRETSTKSIEEYEDTFKRYFDMYGKNLGKEAPFIIIPPSKKRGVKTKILENFQKKKQKVLQGMQKIAIQKQNQSSDLQVVENPNIPKNKKSDQKQKNPPYWFLGKQKREQPNIQLSHCLCRGLVNDQNFFKCSKCQKLYHFDCLKVQKSESENHVCPFCYMKFIDPLNEVAEIIQMQYLQNITESKISLFANFQQFVNQIKAKGNQYEIELRCMRLQDAVNRNPEYTWPDQCIISLNGDKALEFQALQLHSSVKKRKDSSIFITYMIYHENKYLQSLANLKIGMEIKSMPAAEVGQKKIRNNFVFIIGVYLTKKKLVQELYEQIMNQQNNKVKFAENYFNLPDQQQIAIEQIKVNLLDPYTWNMIETPARGNKCTHGQCFDLKTYIGFMNIQRNRNWKCPVCSKECRSLLIDIQQLQAIIEYKRQQQQSPEKSLAPEIVFHKDGRTLFSIQTDGDQEQNMSKSKDQKEAVAK